MAELKGADISAYQGTINFDQLKKVIGFVIIKATESTGGISSALTRNRDGARRVGLDCGFYHFARGGDAIKEADHFVKTVGTLKTGEVLALDWEISHANPVAWCKKFLDRVKARVGFKPLIYINSSTAGSLNWDTVINAGYGLWIASWGTNNGMRPATAPKIGKWQSYVVWQYTSRGALSGIVGNVDLDLLNGIDFKKYGKPAPPATPVPPDPCKPIREELAIVQQELQITKRGLEDERVAHEHFATEYGKRGDVIDEMNRQAEAVEKRMAETLIARDAEIERLAWLVDTLMDDATIGKAVKVALGAIHNLLRRVWGGIKQWLKNILKRK